MLRFLIASLFLVYLTTNPTDLLVTATGTVLNAASLGHEPSVETQIAPGSIATFRGSALAFGSETGLITNGNPPFKVAGTTVTVAGLPARVFYASPNEVRFVVPEKMPAGSAAVVVTNAENVSSQTEVMIKPAAPGIFTVNGDGQGEGIVLDADTLLRAPFDPAGGARRVSLFVTGVRHAEKVSVTINGHQATVEAVKPGGLAGLDEIHLLLPANLSGAGSATLIVDADGVQSNPVSLLISGTPSTAQEKVVISQIFGGGGNSGAPFRNDFIEIFNAGNTPVNLAGWSLQYSGATSATWSMTALSAAVLAPGQYYLVQQAGGNNGALLPAPDASGAIAMAAGAGKVALVRNTTALTGACPHDPSIVDLAGYGGNASCFNGSAPAPAASNTNAATRNANGCTDTRNNASDFTIAPPQPRNTASPRNPCSLANTQSVLLCFRNALAQRRSHDLAPTLRLRRFP